MTADADTARPLVIRARRIRTPARTLPGLLVRDGRIQAVGEPDDLARSAGGAGVLDLGDVVVTAGLTDAHVHLLEWALARRGVDLTDAASPEDAARRVADRAAGSGSAWVRGRGWNAHRWDRPPTAADLDAVLGDRPVLLQSLDMHSFWASSAALRAAGITADTPDPPGGRIERDDDGRPTGVVRENAMPLVLRAAPPPDEAERRAALREGQAELHRLGVTGVHTVEPDSLGVLESARAADELRLRVLQHLSLAGLDDAIRLGLRSGFGGEWIRIGGVKMFLDGALGSRTAWLREPYEGSEDRGISTLPPAEFRDAIRRAAGAGIAGTIHAIGDAAVDLALDVLTERPAPAALPHRIEHVQLVGPDRVGDAARAGIVCSMQPSHLMTDWRAADRHWGDRSRWTYPLRSLLDSGAILALGSDAPVDPPDPRRGLYAAVARQDLDGAPAEGWVPEERITPAEALAGYTEGAAHAAGDRRQGRLEPGAFADLVAWNMDPLEARPHQLLEMRCVWTMVGGVVVWRSG